MAVRPIRQSHSTQAGKTGCTSDQPGAKRSVKRRATTGSPQQGHAEVTQGTPPAATTENDAGYQQKRKQSDHESKGTRVNVYG